MSDLGEVQPFRGRWTWPFAEMQEGEFFRVDQALRAKGAVANLAYVRGSKLGRRFSVTDDPEHVGFTRVVCTDEDITIEPDRYRPIERQALQLSYKKFELFLREHGVALADDYERNFDVAERCSWPVSWVKKPRVDKVIVQGAVGPVDVLLHEDRIETIRHAAFTELVAPEPIEGDVIASLMPVMVDKHDLMAD